MVAHRTYIGCWNPHTFSSYVSGEYVADLYRSKQWQRTHDLRWRASIGKSLDEDCKSHKGVIYAPSVYATLRKGDRVFCLRTGSDNPNQNGLIYSGFYKTDPYVDTTIRIPNDMKDVPRPLHLMAFERDTLLHPSFPTKFTADYLQQRFPKYRWEGSNCGFLLSQKDALALEQEWYDFWSSYDKEFSLDGPLYCQSPHGFKSMYEWTEEDGTIEHGQAWLYLNSLKKEKK